MFVFFLWDVYYIVVKYIELYFVNYFFCIIYGIQYCDVMVEVYVFFFFVVVGIIFFQGIVVFLKLMDFFVQR